MADGMQLLYLERLSPETEFSTSIVILPFAILQSERDTRLVSVLIDLGETWN